MSLRIICSVSVFGLLPGFAIAGPDFIETVDAGNRAETATKVSGSGPLSGINGELEGTGFGPGDFEDMYMIFISDADGFIATTNPVDGGSADFDTQIWLFHAIDTGSTLEALGLLANDEVLLGPPGPSTLRSVATDGTGAEIPKPGVYFLAITGFDRDPHALTAGPIFNQRTRTEISGPDGPGGSQFHVSWVGPVFIGKYRIDLTGAEYLFCPGDVNHDNVVDPLDAGFVMARFGCDVGAGDPDCDTSDVNEDDMVNPLDVGFVLANFGPCFE